VIHAKMIVVPDQALSPYKRADHDEGVRRAVWAIEEGLGGTVEWVMYGGFEQDELVYDKKGVPHLTRTAIELSRFHMKKRK
jgi:hypothetical protein